MIGPAAMRPALADIAAAFHWPLSDLRGLTVSEVTAWRALALALALERAGK